jgi:hypothetical protein
MAHIGDGYGSEWHLLRFLGRHRDHLSAAVLAKTGGDAVHWLDFGFDPEGGQPDEEHKGLGFLLCPPTVGLTGDAALADQWAAFWPQTGNPPNWDAVGLLRHGDVSEWLLVEAKAHIGEMQQSCGAGEQSRRQIEAALAQTREALGVTGSAPWTDGYYQHANRLAVLWFLLSHSVPARLLFIYFTGDQRAGAECPSDEAGWAAPLAAQDAHLGLDTAADPSGVRARVHKLFLPVGG